MSSHIALKADVRENIGKGASRAARNAGQIPAVLYGGEEKPMHFVIDEIQFNKELHQASFYTTIFEINAGKKKERALARAVQFHPVSDRPLHVDFLRVSKDSKLTVAVPLHFINDDKSPGIKRGGVLNIVIHNLEVLCDMDHIPDHIDIDLAGLEIHGSIQLKDIKLPAGAVAAHPDRDDTLANIVAPTIMKQDDETAAEGSAEA
ncbi:50S ribosomal protein L25 [Candidatus Bealeia paramacronuclearis]|uniref:Large ribosomal subunit protein bL25 n=1 Tax=Candidatus Bealeia paramacronuclearis TaxID=1921001 RepID=A0ABZ2C770_9PROT|nr:50S ribosomal protein L25 [Candidatus Bealeia paramacronuclearis]